MDKVTDFIDDLEHTREILYDVKHNGIEIGMDNSRWIAIRDILMDIELLQSHLRSQVDYRTSHEKMYIDHRTGIVGPYRDWFSMDINHRYNLVEDGTVSEVRWNPDKQDWEPVE